MIVAKDQVLDLSLAAGQVVEIILVMRHDLPDPIHQFVSLLDIKGLEYQAKSDLTLATLQLALNEANHGLINVGE